LSGIGSVGLAQTDDVGGALEQLQAALKLEGPSAEMKKQLKENLKNVKKREKESHAAA
jgi:hypothetical protein